MKTKLFALVLFFFWVVPALQMLSENEVFAQYVDTAWVRTYDGPASNYDEAAAIAVDNSDYIYVTGYSIGSVTSYDYATIKYLPNGDIAWVRRYNGPGNYYDFAKAIAVDGSGNVYVTGRSTGSGTGYDYATIKYNPSGDTAWIKRYSQPTANSDEATALAVDGSGNVYVTGYSYSPVSGGFDYLTIKYQPNGDTSWIRRYNGTGGGNDETRALALDGSGNVYVTGRSEGSGINGQDFATIKYNPSGNTVWVRRYDSNNSSDRASVMATDASGNIYVTGLSYLGYMSEDITTIKYNSNGDTAWVRRYTASIDTGDYPRAIIVNGAGDIFVAGNNYNEETGYDYLTLKYHANGDTAWVREYNGPAVYDDMVYDMALDVSGNVYVTGTNMGDAQTTDGATVKYDPAGKQLWAAQYDGPENGDDSPHAITVDQSNHVLVAGASDFGEGGGYDYATIKYFQYDSIPFAPAVNYEAGDGPASVFSADLDGDTDLDLVVVNTDSDNVSVFMNNGNGSFQSAVHYSVGDYPISVFCADLDGDADLDIAVANLNNNNVSILKNNGNGTFQNAVNYGTGWNPNSVFCADLDSDADMDLAVAERGNNTVAILKNNGDGSFQSAGNYGTPGSPNSVFCADLDGDIDLDLAVITTPPYYVSIYLNNGNGTFQGAVTYGVGTYPMSVFCADLDGDFDLDIATANWWGNNVSILRNNGNGSFESAVNYPAGDGPYSVFCADLDGDFDPDLAVADIDGDKVSILKNNGNGTFQSAVSYGAEDNPVATFCADLDGDADFDLAVVNYVSDSISILENLTQVPANQPPRAFPLISPSNQDTLHGPILFQWHIPYDPNFGDQMRYDLYVSTSPGFEPLYTTIDSNLHVSRFTAVLDSGTYWWKVKAKDNWGAETWSSQVWSFYFSPLNDTLRSTAFSPVDLILTDPNGDSIGLGFNTISDASYDTTQDVNQDGDKDDLITLPERLVGQYMIRVFPEPVVDKATYSLGIRIDGGSNVMLAQGHTAPNPGAVDTFYYNAPKYMSGDANGDWKVDVGDVICLINYLYKNGPAPYPLESGDANCSGVIEVGDILYLINYLFKGGPAPAC